MTLGRRLPRRLACWARGPVARLADLGKVPKRRPIHHLSFQRPKCLPVRRFFTSGRVGSSLPYDADPDLSVAISHIFSLLARSDSGEAGTPWRLVKTDHLLALLAGFARLLTEGGAPGRSTGAGRTGVPCRGWRGG